MASLSSIPGLDAALAAIKQGSRDGAVNDDGTVRNTYPDLPHDREYRVEVVEATYKHSQSGAEGIGYVMEVTEGEFKGGKVWDNVYFTGHPFQGQRLAVLLAAASAEADSVEVAAKAVVGGKLVIALKEGNDPRYPQTRWVNLDQGQKLREGLKPPKQSGNGSTAALSADSVDDMIQQRNTVSPPTATTPRPAGGIKLPGSS
jgi:hypothetical protein